MRVPADTALRLGEHVAAALGAGRAVVALETTLIAHGLPAPENLEVARELESIVREEGAEAATVGIVKGVPTVGLSPEEIEALASGGTAVRKASVRDLAAVVAFGLDGATTVAATVALADLAGVAVMATGGIGGVHRGARESFDESADLLALHEHPVLVVAAGAKSILDLPATLERLETLSVPVVGYRTDRFPAFYVASSDLRLEWTVDSPEQAARAFVAHRLLAKGGMLLANPVSSSRQLDPELHDAALAEALRAAQENDVHGKAVTPFLLARLAEVTAGESVRVNRAVVTSNAALAARVAVALARSGG